MYIQLIKLQFPLFLATVLTNKFEQFYFAVYNSL